MTVKRVITTKAIAAPSGCFLSVWIRIQQHSSLRKLQYKQALAAAVPTACQQCTKHSSALGAPHPRDPTRIPPSRIETITSLAPGSSTFQHPTSSAAPWRKMPRFDSIEAEKALVRIQNLNANLMAFPSLVPTFDVVARRRRRNLPRVAARLANHLQPDDWIWSAAGVQF
jgi:hypothetical protein